MSDAAIILVVVLGCALVASFLVANELAGQRDKWRDRARLSTAQQEKLLVENRQLKAQMLDLESKGLMGISRALDVYQQHGRFAALRAWRRGQ